MTAYRDLIYQHIKENQPITKTTLVEDFKHRMHNKTVYMHLRELEKAERIYIDSSKLMYINDGTPKPKPKNAPNWLLHEVLTNFEPSTPLLRAYATDREYFTARLTELIPKSPVASELAQTMVDLTVIIHAFNGGIDLSSMFKDAIPIERADIDKELARIFQIDESH